MKSAILLLFCLAILGCIFIHISILYALIFGLVLFLLYGRFQKHSWKQLWRMATSGMQTVQNILLTFILIGMLTALWRACGTIPFLVSLASQAIYPPLFVLMIFLLNCGISILTGTALGTAATMGVICATIASAMGISPILTGGAVLVGSYFGDRCSPVSTSALLVSEITQTDLFENIKGMYQTAWIPFGLSCGLYILFGIFSPHKAVFSEIPTLFRENFSLHWVTLLPAAVILLFAFLRVPVKKAMLLSILSAFCLCIVVQKLPLTEILWTLLRRYQAHDPRLSAMINGGGIYSMLRVGAIVLISSSYIGLFDGTKLLEPVQKWIYRANARITPYGVTFLCSVITAIISCNQALTIMLTHQLCSKPETPPRFALALENTAVVIPPLIPWSIACAVPLSTIGIHSSCILAAFFLYLLPLCQFPLPHKK